MACGCREAPLLLAAEAWDEYAAAATSAAATKVNFVIGVLHIVMGAKEARLLLPRATIPRNYCITCDHQSASATSTGDSRIAF
jgi:hypothetical protein